MKYRVRFRNGDTFTVEAASDRQAETEARLQWWRKNPYYGSSRAGHKNEQKARNWYNRQSKPIGTDRA